MVVPFEKIGPNQSMRAVYQVIGSDGPVKNPAGIRYLPVDKADLVDDVSSSVAGLDILAGGAQLAAIGIGVVNFGLTTAVLLEVKKLRKKLDVIENKLDQLDTDVKEILTRVRRIDIAVAESHLREAMKSSLRNALMDNEQIDLTAFDVLSVDLERFIDTLENLSPGLHSGLKLSSDVREMVNGISNLLCGARSHTWGLMNQMVKGEPSKVQSDVGAIFTVIPNVEAIVGIANIYDISIKNVDTSMISNLLAGWRSDNGDSDPRFATTEAIFDVFYQVMPTETLVVNELFEYMDFESDVEKQKYFVENFLSAWYTSDAALLWGLNLELRMRTLEGFWPNSDSSPELEKILQEIEKPVTLDIAAVKERISLIENVQ